MKAIKERGKLGNAQGRDKKKKKKRKKGINKNDKQGKDKTAKRKQVQGALDCSLIRASSTLLSAVSAERRVAGLAPPAGVDDGL